MVRRAHSYAGIASVLNYLIFDLTLDAIRNDRVMNIVNVIKIRICLRTRPRLKCLCLEKRGAAFLMEIRKNSSVSETRWVFGCYLVISTNIYCRPMDSKRTVRTPTHNKVNEWRMWNYVDKNENKENSSRKWVILVKIEKVNTFPDYFHFFYYFTLHCTASVFS